MDAEKINLNEKQNLTSFINSETNNKVLSGRVDINLLLARARKEKGKENKINLVLFSMVSAVILVVGIILSF